MFDIKGLRDFCETATWEDLELAQAIVEEQKRKIKQQRIDEMTKEVIEVFKEVKRSGMDFLLVASDGKPIGYLGKDHINIILEYVD